MLNIFQSDQAMDSHSQQPCTRVFIVSVSLTFGILIFDFRYSNKCVTLSQWFICSSLILDEGFPVVIGHLDILFWEVSVQDFSLFVL